MKVSISVGGRFHAFHLAEQMAKKGVLERLITSYPASIAAKAGVPRERVRSILLKEVAERSWGKLPPPIRRRIDPQFRIAELFDILALRKVVPSDIFVGFASFSLRSMRKARSLGAKIVLEDGSSHIELQREIMLEEYSRWGIRPVPFEIPNPKMVEKELAEYAEADAIVIPSEFARQSFIERGVSEEKIIKVPYGVDISFFHPRPKGDDVFRIVFRSNLTLRKGILYLLQAWKELGLPNAELLVIGSIDPEIEHLIRPYAGSFRHMPHQPMDKLAELYPQGSVFILPSLEDGFAMVLIQAMASGLPVIATKNSGGPDIIENGKEGFLLGIRDVEALKEKILYLYENLEERDKMGQAAAAKVASGFTWNDYGDKIMTEYEKILG